jgi:hypothetical protein
MPKTVMLAPTGQLGAFRGEAIVSTGASNEKTAATVDATDATVRRKKDGSPTRFVTVPAAPRKQRIEDADCQAVVTH